MARPYRFVPNSFEEFSSRRVRRLTDAELLISGPYGCRGCGAHAAFGYLDSTREMLCEGCLRYHLGYEQAEERSVRLIVSSAVAGGLAAGAPEDMIRMAVEDALHESVRVDADAGK
jgi:hypothetical protein